MPGLVVWVCGCVCVGTFGLVWPRALLVSERDVHDPAYHLKRYRQFLHDRQWDEARAEWRFTPDAATGEESALDQFDRLFGKLMVMLDSGQFEAVRRAMDSLRAELPGYREEELAEFGRRIAAPMKELERIDRLSVENPELALGALVLLHEGEEPWCVENVDTRKARLQQAIASRRQRGGGPATATAVDDGRHFSWSLAAAVAAVLLATGLSWLVWRQGRPDVVSAPVVAEQPALIVESVPEVVELPPPASSGVLPVAVADDLTGRRELSLADVPERRQALVPLAALTANDRQMPAGDESVRLEVRAVSRSGCVPRIVPEGVQVSLQAGYRTVAGRTETVFQYRHVDPATGVASGADDWAEVRLRVFLPPLPVEGLHVAASPTGEGELSARRLFPELGGSVLVEPWRFRLAGAPWQDIELRSGQWRLPLPALWEGEPRRFELAGGMEEGGEIFELSVEATGWPGRFVCRKDDCVAGRQLSLYERDVRGARFPYRLRLAEATRWRVTAAPPGLQVELGDGAGEGELLVKPQARVAGEVRLAGLAWYGLPPLATGGEATQVECEVEVTLRFDRRPEEDPPPPPPSTNRELAPVVRLGIGSAASETRISLPQELLLPGSDGDRRGLPDGLVLRHQGTPPGRVRQAACRDGQINLVCQAPVLVRLDCQGPELAEHAVRPVYLLVASQRGCLAKDDRNRVAGLANLRLAENFKANVVEEQRELLAALPVELRADVASQWLTSNLAVLDEALAGGQVRDRETRDLIEKRLREISALIATGG